MGGDGEESKDKKEEEEAELYVGDSVRLSTSVSEVKSACEALSLPWDPQMGQFVGQKGQVVKIEWKEDGDGNSRQVVTVKFGGAKGEGPAHVHSAAVLEYLDEEEDEADGDDKDEAGAEDAQDEDKFGDYVFRVNEKVRNESRAKLGKVATGIITGAKDGGSPFEVRYDDGSTENEVKAEFLRPIEKMVCDGSGFTGGTSLNVFDFTTSSLPTGVEVVGEGVELQSGRGGETFLTVRKGTFLKVPLSGLRHEKVKSDDSITNYTLTLELQLSDAHTQLLHPWSVFQASFPEVHETDEISIAALRKTCYPKLKVGSDVEKLIVTAAMEPDSDKLVELKPGTVVQQCGDVQRLNSGVRRIPIKFKRQSPDDDKDKSGDKGGEEHKNAMDSDSDSDVRSVGGRGVNYGGDRDREEDAVLEVHAGFFGSGSAEVPTLIQVASNGILKTLSFRPGADGGKARVDQEAEVGIGWTPVVGAYHILKLTLRSSGKHTFVVMDCADSSKKWEKEFHVQGWWDDLYGVSGIRIYDANDTELELGTEVVRREASGEHKMRLVRHGKRIYHTDELDPRGWVNFSRANLEQVDQEEKIKKGPSCHIQVKEKTVEKRLNANRWHSLTFTVNGDTDTMTVFVDGEKVQEIDIYDFGGGGFGMDEEPTKRGKRDSKEKGSGSALKRRGGMDISLDPFAGLGGWGGFGGFSRQSPFAVPQEGFLLFASSSTRAMPGGMKLRKVIFRNTVLESQVIESLYVNSRHKKRPAPVPPNLVLAPILRKKAPPVWLHSSFVAETCNPFIQAANGPALQMFQVFCLALKGMVASLDAGWSAEETAGFKKILDLFQAAEPLYKKWQPLWMCNPEDADQLAALSGSYLKRLASCRAEMTAGSQLIVPLGLKLESGNRALLTLLLEKKASGRYRFVIVCSSPVGLQYHAASAAEPPKLKYRTALELDNVPAERAEDEAWWMMLVTTTVQHDSDGSPLYDKLLPWLAGAPLEHMLARQQEDYEAAGEKVSAAAEWRTPQQAKTDSWRSMTFLFRVLAREVAGLTRARAKLAKWTLRKQLVVMASKDLQSVKHLSVSERRLLRFCLSQLATSAVKVSGILPPGGAHKPEPLLMQAQKFVQDTEDAIARKPRPYGFDDPSVLPILDLNSGATEAPAEEWGLYPLFDRLLREQKSPGTKVGIPLLVPIDLLAMPEKIEDFEAAFEMLRLCEELCSKLTFVGAERCKFGPFLKVALLQNVFTELLPLPVGPVAEGPPICLVDPIWAPNGCAGVHPQMTRSAQLEMLLLLRRLCEHFVAAVSSIKASQGFDAVKIVVLGAIAACTDRVARTRVRRVGSSTEVAARQSEFSELINGFGPTEDWRPLAVDPATFLKQSETIEVTAPELNIARTGVVSYFSGVLEHLVIKKGKDETLFDWDIHGWMLWTEKEKGLGRLVKKLCAAHLYQVGDWPAAAAGLDQYMGHTWPEYECFRDIIFWWKYFLCTDLNVFPATKDYIPMHAYLKWNVADEQNAFGSAPNRGKVFQLSALGKEHLMTTGQNWPHPANRPKPKATGLRWPSAAQASQYTKQPVRTEDDLLYMRSLPTFNETLRPADSEALLSFLTVPYIRTPLVLAFFTTADRVNCLFEPALQKILHAVILEPGRLLAPKRWGESPTTIPAVSTQELELVGTPYGQLLTELACAPSCICAYMAKLVELTLVLANSAMSQTVNLILFVARLAARVESSISLLMHHADGKLKSGGPLPGALPMTPTALAELRAGRKRLRKLFVEVDSWLDTWLEELHDLAQKAMQRAKDEEDEGDSEDAQSMIDEYMRRCCNIHAHVLLLLRNVSEDEMEEAHVSRLLCSLSFLSLHHTWNADHLDMPEPEIFEVYHHHRRGIVRWFERQQQAREYRRFNKCLQEVHSQFATIDSANAMDTAQFEWGAIGGDKHNAGRYCVVGPARSTAEKGDIVIAKSEDTAWVELNVQLMQVTVRGRHVTPLENDTAGDKDFQEVMRLGEGSQSSETVQCAALLTTNLVHLRELLSHPYRTTRWTDMPWTMLPYLGDYDRLYDIEDLEEHEAWIPELFEPVRLKFFTVPTVQKDILFFMREETHRDASMVVIAGVHPDCRGKIWKEVLVFRDLRMVQVFRIVGYGWQQYRTFEYTTDARYALAESQPSPQDRDEPWPDWGRHEAGAPKLKPNKSPASVVLTRVLVRDTEGSGNCGAGTKKSDPLDDPDEWSDGEPSDDETEAEKAERTVWEKSQREGEQYLPSRFMLGLLPSALLKAYRIYQENEPPCRMLRGYPLKSEGDEEENPDHILEVKLVKCAHVPATKNRGWCGIVRKRYKDTSKPPMYLLNLLYAREGTPLQSMARSLSRLEHLSHVLAWTKSDPRAEGARDPTVDLVELPRLMLTFVVRAGTDGTRRLWSVDHAELSFPIGPHTTLRSEASKLLLAIPHSVLLQTKNEELFALVPNVKPARPHVGSDPFSSELVLERTDAGWMETARNRTFLYPVHASNNFLQASTRAAALYLLLLRWMNRDYSGSAKLVSGVGTDTKYEEDEDQIFQHLGNFGDVHPASYAITVKVTLAVADAGMRWPWDVPEFVAGYMDAIMHIPARCRITTAEETRLLGICSQIRKTLEIIDEEVKDLKFRLWGQWGQIKLQRYAEILSSVDGGKEASYQEFREVDSWVRALVRKLRASQLPGTKDDVKYHVLQSLGGYEIDKKVLLTLDNRNAFLERIEGTDGAGPDDPLMLACLHRPKETLWQAHFDQNFLLCSLFDFNFEVLGLNGLYKDAEDEEGPEIPQMRRMSMPMAVTLIYSISKGSNSLRDYGKAPQTFALFYSMFTKSLGVRLGRSRDTNPAHQHTYAELLLHLMPGGRHHGVLASLLHIMAINPKTCETLPLLSKPKKVRLVKQWKQKLMEIYSVIVGAANGMALEWPPHEDDFDSLPEPVRSAVSPQRLELPSVAKGLCPRQLFCPEVPQVGASILGTPKLTSVTCDVRSLRGTGAAGALPDADAAALSSQPLAALCKEFLTEVDPMTALEEAMPFDLSTHPLSKHRVAASLFSRLEREVALCARKRNASKRPVLTMMRDEHIRAIVEGDKAKLTAAREQVAALTLKLTELKARDTAFVASAIRSMEDVANNMNLGDKSTEAEARARLRFWLLRYAGMETEIWFEHLCCGLLSPKCESDFQLLNPFLSTEAAAGILGSVSQMMLVASRIVAVCRCLDSCFDLLQLLDNPDVTGSKVALEAGLSEKSKVLCGLLSSKRTFFTPVTDAQSPAGFEAKFDPRFLIFEFVTGFLLRPRQVEMVSEFLQRFLTGTSVVKQMIMGAGKTSVVSPMLALMLAEGSRLVCLVVPQALIMLSRSVMQNAFSTVVQKRVSTFKCDRSLDLEVNLSMRIARVCSQGDIMLSTPGDVKSLQLRFLESLGMANDRRAKKNTPQMRRECVEMGRMLEQLKRGVCMIDEVDLVLHPLKSELNFPIGQKSLIDHAPERWNLVLHLLDGFFSIDKDRIPQHLKDSLRAQQILDSLRAAISRGCDLHYLQRNPHLVLLNEEFYHTEVKPIMCEWLSLWLTSEHVGRVFDKGSVAGDRGLSDEEIKAYVLHRVRTLPRVEHETSLEQWQGWFEGEPACLSLAEGGSVVCALEATSGAELPFGVLPRSEYKVERLQATGGAGNVRLAIEETKEGATKRESRVERLAPKDLKSMNLCFDWLQVFLPYSLQKIDRVTFGIMSAEQVTAALIEQPLMPLTRAKLAIPFVGKDVPSQASEFAHPDIVIGLTVFAYRYEGLRRNDFDEVLGMLNEQVESENGSMMERPTSLLWKAWVEEAGALFCVKQAELDDQTAADILASGDEDASAGKAASPKDAAEGSPASDRHRTRVLPLHLLERKNEANMVQLFELMRRLPSAVHFYLQNSIFPAFMRFQDEKLSSSGQDLGGSILFGQRIGFSGTPSDLMPKELGQCEYEPGSEGEMIRTMTDPAVCSYAAIAVGWGVESLLDNVIADAHAGYCSALIDTGALITGFTNREVAEYLLGFGKARKGAAGLRPTLPEAVDGVVFLDEDGGKKILLRQTKEAAKLADSGVPPQRRFAFYDQVHTTGMDIQHKLDAVAALTLGKDMNWRDYVQGAYRMRGIGKGQRIRLFVIPEVLELIAKDVELAGIATKLGGGGRKWADSESGRLLAVAAWLLVNSIRTERVQFAMLQVQNLNNIWRKNAFQKVMSDFEIVTSNDLRKAVNVFKEAIAFVVPGCVPHARSVQEVVEERIASMGSYIASEGDEVTIAEVRDNVRMIASMGDEKEGEAGLDTQQQREQEQERQQEQEQEEEKEQEIEIEKFVDMMHCRDDEEPESWEIQTLCSEEDAKQFYPTSQFRLFKRKPLGSLSPESRCSRNWFNPQWGGFRRVKNVFVQMEWTADCLAVARSSAALELNEEQEAEMHKKLAIVWSLLTQGGQRDDPALRQDTEPGPATAEPVIRAGKLRELLSASFDWDPVLHDPVSALASLGKAKNGAITYDEMVQVLRDARFRTRDDGRAFVLLSLAEAETLRRVLHAKAGKPFLDGAPNTALALRCVFASHEILDASTGFSAGPPFQVRMLHQLARFIDGQTFYRPREISVLLRALQGDKPFDRCWFFEGLGGCRRRAGIAHWDNQPVADALRPWLEFEQVLARVRAIRLHDAIYSRGLSVQMAFQRFDANNSGLLEPMEFCRALRTLGFAFDVGEVANWIEAMDTNEDYCIDYAEFFAFCKQQVDSLLGAFAGRTSNAGGLNTQSVASAATKRTVAQLQDGEEEEPTTPGLSRAPQDLAASKNLEFLRAAGKAPIDAAGEDAGGAPPAPARPGKLMRATSAIVPPEDLEEELLRRRALAKREETEEARVKALEAEAIDVLIEEELGTNPCYGDGYGEWDFRGQLLPKETFALGVVDIISESWGSGKGKNFLQLDRKAGLAVQNIRLAPNGDSDRRINRYSMTMWFRTPTLPSKADRMLLLDFPRGEEDMDAYAGEEKEKAGAIYIWRGGVIAPDGYQEPSLRRKRKTGGRHGVDALPGEWQLTFSTSPPLALDGAPPASDSEGTRTATIDMNLTLDESGKVGLKPSRGAAARRAGPGKDKNFGLMVKVQHEKDYWIQRRHRGVEPSDASAYWWTIYHNTCPGSRSLSNISDKVMQFLGYDWKSLGWPTGFDQMRKFNLKSLKNKGEIMLCRGLDAKTATKLAKDLEGWTKGGSKMVEDHTYANEVHVGHKVRFVRLSEEGDDDDDDYSDGDGDRALVGLVGVVTDMDESEVPYLVKFEREGKEDSETWLRPDQIEKAELRQLTDIQWMCLPSTRGNYVHFERKLPNPLLEASPWTARGRAELAPASTGSEAKIAFDVSPEGGLSAYVDAEAFYAEGGGQLRLQGRWHASDGTSGPIEGTKRLAGMAVGGIWHVELQSEADSMAHAWNLWFTCFPGNDQGTVVLTGAILAGPMHGQTTAAKPAGDSKQEPDAAAAAAADSVPGPLLLTGEMTGSGKVKFTLAEGEGRWAGSSWEGELGPDRILRGSWQLAPGSVQERPAGRWRARHIGRKAIHGTLNPTKEEGVKWNEKDCIIEDSEEGGKAKRFQQGSKVKLSKGYKDISDAQHGPLKPGEVGEITSVMGSMFLVVAPNGNNWYYYEAALKEARTSKADEGIQNPLMEDFEGLTFTRFPVSEGSWYAEVQILKRGESPPIIGWGVFEETEDGMELTRMAVVDGGVGRKLDIEKQPEEEEKKEGEEGEKKEGEEGEKKEGEEGEKKEGEGGEKKEGDDGEKKEGEKKEGEEGEVKESEKKEGEDGEQGEGEKKEGKEGEEKAGDGTEEGEEGKAKKEGEEGGEEGAENEGKEEGDEEKKEDGEDGEEGEGDEEGEENKEENKEGEGDSQDKWSKAKKFGSEWEEGDVICCSVTMPEGKLFFGLNGDFQAPMGEAFNMALPEGSRLCLVVAHGAQGRVKVNLGQTGFQYPPHCPGHRGLGEAMRMRPTWQVKLPQEVKAWPVYVQPSRSSEGKKPLKNGDVIELIAKSSPEDGSTWLRHEKGWSPTSATVAGKEHQALTPTPAWKGIDRPEEVKKKKKAMKRSVHASFDVELGEQTNWTFTGRDSAKCEEGPSALLSTESTTSAVLRWCIKVVEGTNFQVGVVPGSQASDCAFLNNSGECGIKNKDASGGDSLKPHNLAKQYIEVIADMVDRKAKFIVGEEREHMVEVEEMDIPYEGEDVRLAITGNEGFECSLEMPLLDKAAESDGSDEEDEDLDELSVTTCGNSVCANTWHIATFAVDLPKGEFHVVLDGEAHLDVRDTTGLVADGPLAIDPQEGLFLFGSTRRGAGGGFIGGEADWRAGGHLRSLRLDGAALSTFDIWSQHLPKGIWRSRAGAWNAAEARVCWRSRETRPKTGVRPPGDMDPRHEGLTVVTAESFRELVLESKSNVFLVASAAWCGACQNLKPRWEQLAKAMAAEPMVTIAIVDIEENEMPSKYFPETYIPNAKLFIAGKKRQPVACRNVGAMEFEHLTAFLEQHTGINAKEAVEKGYPAYCEKHGIAKFMEELKSAAASRPLRRLAGRQELQSLAGLFYEYLLDPSIDIGSGGGDAAEGGDTVSLPPPPIFTRAISDTVPPPPLSLAGTLGAGAAPMPPPSLVRMTSAPPAPGAPPALKRVVSDTAPQRFLMATRPVAVSLAFQETLEANLAKRLCAELVDKQLAQALKSAQPEDPKSFAAQFFLNVAQPSYSHQTFFNARTAVSWQRCPHAKKICAAVMILRFLMRWMKRRGTDIGLPMYAPQKRTQMTPAALRLNWRRVETAISNQEQQRALSDLQLLLDRGYSVNAAPFGTSPLVLASAIGNLPAAQFLYVRGADLHRATGRPKALPVEVAALNGHLAVVRLAVENGSVFGRSLHFAAVGGALDVVKYLLNHGASTQLRVRGLSALGAALLASQHRVAEALLRYVAPSMLSVPLPDDGCRASGLPDGSTLLHLAASLGSLCEVVVSELSQHEELACVRNKSGETAFDLMAGTLKSLIRPEYYSGFEGLLAERHSAALDPGACVTTLRASLASDADASAVDVRGFSLMDLCCLTGKASLVSALLEAKASIEARGPQLPSALMWAHWSGCEDVVVLLSATGASLSNADLEGLQRLRTARDELTEEKTQDKSPDGEGKKKADKAAAKAKASTSKSKAETPKKSAKEVLSASDSLSVLNVGADKRMDRSEIGKVLRNIEEMKGAMTEAEIDRLVAYAPMQSDGRTDMSSFMAWVKQGGAPSAALGAKLMEPAAGEIWFGGAPCRGLVASAAGLAARMNWGLCRELGAPVPIPQEEPEAAAPPDLVKALEVCSAESTRAKAKLLGLRLTAEGSGMSCADVAALHLFTSDQQFHGALSSAWMTASVPNPLQEEVDRMADIDAATCQVAHALRALPAKKVVCYRACRVPYIKLPSGTLKEVLQGHRHALDCYRPGSVVLWRHAVTATTDAALAEELALRGEPVAGCGLVFKVRRAIGARAVRDFSECPEHGEIAFPPNSVFRVVGLFPCTLRCLRRGVAAGEGSDGWSVDVGFTVQRSDALSWEEACRAQSCVVVLDEEDQLAVQQQDALP